MKVIKSSLYYKSFTCRHCGKKFQPLDTTTKEYATEPHDLTIDIQIRGDENTYCPLKFQWSYDDLCVECKAKLILEMSDYLSNLCKKIGNVKQLTKKTDLMIYKDRRE